MSKEELLKLISEWKVSRKEERLSREQLYIDLMTQCSEYKSMIQSSLFGRNGDPDLVHHYIGPPLRAYFPEGQTAPEWLLETGRQYVRLWNICADSLHDVHRDTKAHYRYLFSELERRFVSEGSLEIIEGKKEYIIPFKAPEIGTRIHTKTTFKRQWKNDDAKQRYESEIGPIHKAVDRRGRKLERLGAIKSVLEDAGASDFARELHDTFDKNTIRRVLDNLTWRSRRKEDKNPECFVKVSLSGYNIRFSRKTGAMLPANPKKKGHLYYLQISEPINPLNHRCRTGKYRGLRQIRRVTIKVPNTKNMVSLDVLFDSRAWSVQNPTIKAFSLISKDGQWFFVPQIEYTPRKKDDSGPVVACDPGQRTVVSGREFVAITCKDSTGLIRQYTIRFDDSRKVRKWNLRHPDMEIHANPDDLHEFISKTDLLKNDLKMSPTTALATVIAERDKLLKRVMRAMLANRDRQQRAIAFDLVSRYSTILCENNDVKSLKEKENAGDNREREIQNKVAKIRQYMAPANLTTYIKHCAEKNGAAFILSAGPYHTRVHNTCGCINPDPKGAKIITCADCGQKFNRDENSCANALTVFEAGLTEALAQMPTKSHSDREAIGQRLSQIIKERNESRTRHFETIEA